MIKIIPAIDVIEGKCVRLSQGDYQKMTVYHPHPLDVAKKFEDSGITHLHLVDLDGAREKKIINYKVIEKIATHTRLHIDFGGGLQTDKDVEIAFECGAKQITGGSIAIKNETLFSQWITRYGSEKIILGADSKNGQIAIHGWQETAEIGINQHLKNYTEKGIQYCIATDVAKDGMLQGPSFDLYKQVLAQFPALKLIASGGVSALADIEALNELGLYGVIVGKAYYEGKITLNQMAQWALKNF